jgi:hypothetical protein
VQRCDETLHEKIVRPRWDFEGDEASLIAEQQLMDEQNATDDHLRGGSNEK